MKHNFTDDDKKKVIEFLNTVANKAKFELNTQEVISYFKLLSFMQQELLPKIDANIMEIKRIIEAEKEEPKKKNIKSKGNE